MIDLYYLPTCPYCKKVIKFLEENNIKYNLIDINIMPNEEVLIKIGGKRQVPFIVDKKRNIEMYESDEIIEYLKTIL